MRRATVMFYTGEAVHSSQHGFGLVAESGRDPVVEFMDTGRLAVSGEQLRVIPQAAYDAEVMNRTLVERWLDWRIHGVVQRRSPVLPRPALDLAAAMQEAPPTVTTQNPMPYGVQAIFADR
jgi:hypothetical protein